MSKERLDSGWSHVPESASVHVPIDIFLVIKGCRRDRRQGVVASARLVRPADPGADGWRALRLRLARRYLHARIRLRASDRRARITKVGIRGLDAGSSLEGHR